MKRNILIPKLRSPLIYETTAKNLIFMDRGGLILSPVTGLHENVAALDFESMFPNILIKHNISYETATPNGLGRCLSLSSLLSKSFALPASHSSR
jgi:DNA polymerase I